VGTVGALEPGAVRSFLDNLVEADRPPSPARHHWRRASPASATFLKARVGQVGRGITMFW